MDYNAIIAILQTCFITQHNIAFIQDFSTYGVLSKLY